MVRTPKLDRRRFFVAAAALAAPAAPPPAPVRLLRKLRIGLLGIEGTHSSAVTGVLDRLPDLEVVALSDPDPALRARTLARPRVGGAKPYADWKEMLAREKLDLVAINNNNGDRARTILACAARGLHVFTERPLALTRADLAEVKRTVASKKIALGMQAMRFGAAYQAIRKIVADGLIGEVAQIAGQKSYQLVGSDGVMRAPWFFHRASYGGTIPWIGLPMIDLIRWTGGHELRQVVGYKARIGFPEIGDMENVSASLFKLDNGGVADMRLDFLRPLKAPGHGDDRLRLVGTKGVVEHQEATGLTLITADKALTKMDDLPPGKSGFIDFLEATYLGKPPGFPLADIYRVSELALAAHEAAESGRPLSV
jgi:predicted dehydrogenase